MLSFRSSESDPQESFHDAKMKMIAAFERTYIERLLLAHHGNISQAARAAQKNRRAFWELVRKYQIRRRKLQDIMNPFILFI